MSDRCPHHAALTRKLALGQLDGDAATDAERTISACPVCRVLWSELVDGHAELLAAVREGFAEAQLPQRRRRAPWLAAAAAVVVAAAGAGVSLLQRPVEPPADTQASQRIVAGVFGGQGNGDLNGDGVRDAADLALALQRSGDQS